MNCRTTLALSTMAVLFMASSIAVAQDAPPTYEGDPDVYKVIFEDQNFRVIAKPEKKGCMIRSTVTLFHRSLITSPTVQLSNMGQTARPRRARTRLVRPGRSQSSPPIRPRILVRRTVSKSSSSESSLRFCAVIARHSPSPLIAVVNSD
jgi:hypothetical protein